MKRIAVLILSLLLTLPLTAQQLGKPSIDWRGRSLTLELDAPRGVSSATAQRSSGNPGLRTLYYWVVTQTLAGASSPAGPFAVSNAPDALSANATVAINWVPVANAVSYDVLRTSTMAPPQGACNCAVATGVSGAGATDQSELLVSYTVAPLDPSASAVTFTNEANGLTIRRGGLPASLSLGSLSLGKTVLLGDGSGGVNVRAFGAKGSDAYTTVACTSGSNTVTVANAKDFANGDGVHLFHCGNPITLAAPAGLTHQVFGTAGISQMTYWVSALTKNGGQGPASTPLVVSDAPSSYTMGNGLMLTWNSTGADGYAIYHQTATGNQVLKAVVTVPDQAQWWVKDRPYHTGDAVRPKTDNGHWYKATGVRTRPVLQNGSVLACEAGVLCRVTPLSMTGIFEGSRLMLGGMESMTAEVATASNVTATTFDVTPTKRQPFGFTIEALSGATEPTWCTTAGCTVQDGGITWTEQAFYFYEDGSDTGPAAMWSWNGPPQNRIEQAVELTPPASNLAETLVTSVIAGGGTTTLTLANAAGANSSGFLIEHDDTTALNAAITWQQQNQARSTQPAYEGQPASTITGCVYLPWGKSGRYKISSKLPIPACMYGENSAIIEQVHPLQNLLSSGDYAYSSTLRNLSLWGGLDSIQYLNGNNGGQVWMNGVKLIGCGGTAVFASQSPIFNGDNDNHLSSEFHLSDVQVWGCRHMVYNTADQFTMSHVSFFANVAGQDPESAYFVNDSGMMSLDDFFASPPAAAVGNRWFDHRFGSLHVTKSRFGGESAGMPIAYTKAPYDYSRGYGGLNLGLNYLSGQVITVENSAICSPGGRIVAWDALPGFVHFRGNNCTDNNGTNAFIDTSRLNLNEVLYDTTTTLMDATRFPGYDVIKYDIDVQQNNGGSATLAAQLLPNLISSEPVRLPTIPTAGNWMKHQVVYNSNTLQPGDSAGWVNLRSGRAAPTWLPGSAYNVGDWVLPSNDNGHVYYATGAGTSGSSEPAWVIGQSSWSTATTTDGTVTWADYGPAALFAPYGNTGSGLQLNDIKRNGIGNRLAWSEDFTHWQQNGVTVTGGQSDPWGGTGAYLITRAGAGENENVTSGDLDATSLTPDQYFTCWLKAGTAKTATVQLWDATANAWADVLNISLPSKWTRTPLHFTVVPGHTFGGGIGIYPVNLTQQTGTMYVSTCQMWNEDSYYIKTSGAALVDIGSGFYLSSNARLDGGMSSGNTKVDATGVTFPDATKQTTAASLPANAVGYLYNDGTIKSWKTFSGISTYGTAVHLTGVTGNVASTNWLTGVPAGKYRVNCFVGTTTAGSSANIDVFFTYTSPQFTITSTGGWCRVNGSATITNWGTGQAQFGTSGIIDVGGTGTLTYSTTANSSTAVYKVDLYLEQLP